MNPDRLRLHQAALALSAKSPHLTYIDCVKLAEAQSGHQRAPAKPAMPSQPSASLRLHEAALALCAKNPLLTYIDCVKLAEAQPGQQQEPAIPAMPSQPSGSVPQHRSAQSQVQAPAAPSVQPLQPSAAPQQRRSERSRGEQLKTFVMTLHRGMAQRDTNGVCSPRYCAWVLERLDDNLADVARAEIQAVDGLTTLIEDLQRKCSTAAPAAV